MIPQLPKGAVCEYRTSKMKLLDGQEVGIYSYEIYSHKGILFYRVSKIEKKAFFFEATPFWIQKISEGSVRYPEPLREKLLELYTNSNSFLGKLRRLFKG